MADGIPDFFGTPGKTGLVFLGTGAVVVWISSRAPDARGRNLGIALGSGLVGLGIFKLATIPADLTAATAEAVKGAESLPPGTGSVFERILGAAGRTVGLEQEPGAESSPDRPAVAGPQLGVPKNVLRVAGKIRSPSQGGSITVRLGENTYAVDAAIENQSGKEVTGTAILRLALAGKTELLEATKLPLTLGPGEFRQLSFQVPFVQVGFTPFREHELALLFESHKLDSVTYKISRSFF